MHNVIRLGDATSHGGKVLSAQARHMKVQGRPVACVGDPCRCPISGHKGCTIATGSERHHIDGKAIGFHGDKTSCGATLIASAADFRTP